MPVKKSQQKKTTKTVKKEESKKEEKKVVKNFFVLEKGCSHSGKYYPKGTKIHSAHSEYHYLKAFNQKYL